MKTESLTRICLYYLVLQHTIFSDSMKLTVSTKIRRTYVVCQFDMFFTVQYFMYVF